MRLTVIGFPKLRNTRNWILLTTLYPSSSTTGITRRLSIREKIPQHGQSISLTLLWMKLHSENIRAGKACYNGHVVIAEVHHDILWYSHDMIAVYKVKVRLFTQSREQRVSFGGF